MPLRRPALLAAAAAATTAALVGTTVPAFADDSALTPKTTFTFKVDATTGSVTLPSSGEDIPNVDSVKSSIRAYYKASSGLANRTASPYITEVAGIESQIEAAYPALTGSDIGTKAIVFDTDDTLLWNYDYEDKGSNFNYDATSNAAWVTGSSCLAADGTDYGAVKTGAYCFPEVPGSADLVKTLAARGYKLYVVTGRPASQKQATIDNLTAAGFVDSSSDPIFTSANVYTKWETGSSSYDATTVPDYIKNGQCTTIVSGKPNSYKCTTVEYKAQTRKHIEDADDVEIVGNVGDQLSDLWGGYANQGWKIPNPTYFLSSPNLDAVHVGSDDQSATLQPASSYTMAADGSTFATDGAKGDGIPNIDPVRTEIRAWYAATSGIANKTSSPYISEITSLASSWATTIAGDCTSKTTAIKTATTKKAAAQKAVRKASAAVKKATKALRKAHGKSAKRKAKRKLASAKHTLAARQTAWSKITIPGTPAVVLDADDTTLWTYDMEDGAMKFVFSSTVQNNDWVQPQKFPATPGMVDLVAKVSGAGCTIIGLTGRGDSQKDATLGNLAKVGYTQFTAANYYTKPSVIPSYLDCASDGTPACSTIEYKSGTRKMLETSRGFDIVANLGDQYSDLKGGYADASYKLPNPTYYLP
ncbi:MAG: HAD family acid phosphatase [Nocardioides sp.]|uniref:HAD family acid phosphatase n=1 Tax=Nocardioides sp. TaxID=35761 RepID=UPI0039E47D30